MSKDSQSWMKSLTGISKRELLNNSKPCNSWELTMKFLKREDVIFRPSEFPDNVDIGNVDTSADLDISADPQEFYIFTNFRESLMSKWDDMISYEIYDAIWDNNDNLIWTHRNDTNQTFENPLVHSRHNYVLMGSDAFYKIDAEFMQKRMLWNLFLNWDNKPWSDLK